VIAKCYHDPVPTLNIRNVPAEVAETLKQRAKARGVSLNAEVVETLTAAARRRSVDEVLANIDRIRGDFTLGNFDEFLAELRRDRDERDERIWRAATRPAGD
jgi:plasmid stability protein